MKITPLMLKVLRAVEANEGCGANYLVDVIFPDRYGHMSLRAGQYMGRLRNMGLIRKTFDEYHGKRGQLIAMSVSYYLTEKARDILRSER